MNTSDKLAAYVLPTYGRAPLAFVKGQGTKLWDEKGQEYLDFSSGIAVCSLGHCHPKVAATMAKQAETLVHCSNLFQIPQQGELAELMVTRCLEYPGKVFFANSGAESNDGMIKTARRFGHVRPAADGSPRYEVLTFKQSFHGRTLGSMAATGQDKIKVGFDPLLVGFRHLPLNDLEAAKAAISKETVAFMLEPIQAEGGVFPASSEFLHGLVQLCKEHDLLLMIDEVQTGMGRCGEMMGWRSIAPDIKPDCVSFAKGIAGGIAMGAFFVSDRAIDETGKTLSSIMDAGSHGSTFGGTPFACATALTVVKEILNQKLPARAKILGEHIKEVISSWNLPVVKMVRGNGLLLGIILDETSFTVPEGMTPAVYVGGLLRNKFLLTVGAGPQAVRLLPPLTVSDAEVEQALMIIKEVLSSLK